MWSDEGDESNLIIHTKKACELKGGCLVTYHITWQPISLALFFLILGILLMLPYHYSYYNDKTLEASWLPNITSLLVTSHSNWFLVLVLPSISSSKPYPHYPFSKKKIRPIKLRYNISFIFVSWFYCFVRWSRYLYHFMHFYRSRCKIQYLDFFFFFNIIAHKLKVILKGMEPKFRWKWWMRLASWIGMGNPRLKFSANGFGSSWQLAHVELSFLEIGNPSRATVLILFSRVNTRVWGSSCFSSR